VDAGWVVLCAVTYGSPPILLRSGIGPADHLRSIGCGATAKTHVAGILQKLDLRDRVQAVIYAYETGLVAPGARR
jgi:choline dehydrogenase-like flavoprotein